MVFFLSTGLHNSQNAMGLGKVVSKYVNPYLINKRSFLLVVGTYCKLLCSFLLWNPSCKIQRKGNILFTLFFKLHLQFSVCTYGEEGWEDRIYYNGSLLKLLIIHQLKTKYPQIMTMTVFGHVILISIDFYNFSFMFERYKTSGKHILHDKLKTTLAD